MKVLHYVPSIDRESGGVGSYIQLLAKPLGRFLELHVATHRSTHELLLENCQIHYIERWTHFLTMEKQWVELLEHIDPDVVHVNCCWQPESAMVQRLSRKRGYNTVYSPHGMLEPWIMKHHYWTKKIPALLLYQRAAIKNADIIHVTADSEYEHLIALGYNRNIAVIANGIDVDQIEIKNKWQSTKVLLFLSRVHVKKGIDLLINSVAELKECMQEYHVLIAGEGDYAYIAELKTLAREKEVDNIVSFVGGVYGEEKWNLYRQADVFILPTHSENFGIVIAEALASGTPVLTTKGTPWEELLSRNCGWWVDCTQMEITNALRQALYTSDETLEEMGRNGRRLMEECYSVEAIAYQMKVLYEWILGERKKPNFVYTDIR